MTQISKVESWKEASKSSRSPDDDVDMTVPILCFTQNINRFRYLASQTFETLAQESAPNANICMSCQAWELGLSPRMARPWSTTVAYTVAATRKLPLPSNTRRVRLD